jgi:hypothetical protein
MAQQGVQACDGRLEAARLVRRLGRAYRAAWSALPGDALGRLAMRGCGIPSPTRVIVVNGIRVNVIEDPRAGRLLDHQVVPLAAQTLGRYVFARERLSDHTLAHELEHVRQWRRYGPLFEPVYWVFAGLALLRRRRPYVDNRFEVAAERRADAEEAARGAAREATRKRSDS